uniref:Transmembrane protein n=2 Tax=Parascaris univalens TaxID=6257 RepID=A0A915A439_PARUN
MRPLLVFCHCRIEILPTHLQWIWALFGTFMFVFAPVMAVTALLYSDIEWCFPAVANRRGTTAAVLLFPMPITIMCYIVIYFASLAVNVQLMLEDGSVDFSAWRECVTVTALVVVNIYCLLLTVVVIQMVYAQHLIVIEDQVASPF